MIEAALQNLIETIKREQAANDTNYVWSELWASLRKVDGMPLTSVRRNHVVEILLKSAGIEPFP